MRAFVTGGHGFVGTWLVRHLLDQGDDVVAPHADDVDITDPAAIATAIDNAAPDAVYHLAGFAHVGQSWQRAHEVFTVNATGTLNVLEACRVNDPHTRVLVVSSAEVLGAVTPDDLPLTEDAPIMPVSPYAASKAAAELLTQQAHRAHGTHAIVARPFNHTGPGQSPEFVVPAFARRIKEATTTLDVGNLTPRRDMTDVRDVVRAYRLLIEHGEPGHTYNVCSGTDIAIADLVGRMCELAGKPDLELRQDPDLFRPADIPVLRGDPAKLTAATGWTPQIPLDQTLTDVLA